MMDTQFRITRDGLCVELLCDKSRFARGYCQQHYTKYRKSGQLGPASKRSVEERRVDRNKSAQRSYHRDVDKSRQRSRDKVDVVRQKRLVLINQIKMERGCADCGYAENPVALHFDHRDPTQKLFGIAKALTCSWERLQAEIEKCDVRCANCHAIRSAQEGHSGRPRLAILVVDGINLNDRMVADGHAVPSPR